MTKRGCDHFVHELNMLIDRMRLEYDMTYAEVVGSLELLKSDVIAEAADTDDSETIG